MKQMKNKLILEWVKIFVIFWQDVRHTLAALDSIAEVVKVTNYSGLCDAESAWKSLCAIRRICQYGWV